MPAPDMPPVVTLTETKQLYWFGHGDAITGGNVRQRLRRGWGFCPRHTWLLFCVEHELRYLPIGAATLYQDLTWHATVLLGQRHPVTYLRRALEPQASCLTCDYLAHDPSEDRAFAEGRARAADATRVRRWTADSRAVWQQHVCPRCETPQPPTPQHAQLCRLHLIENATKDQLAGTADQLARLSVRVLRCVKSMTDDGPPRTPDSDAALVEALGWFAGWNSGRRYLMTP
jgi:hypothetical protein